MIRLIGRIEPQSGIYHSYGDIANCNDSVFKHIFCTLCAKIGFFIVQTATSTFGSLLNIRSAKKSSYPVEGKYCIAMSWAGFKPTAYRLYTDESIYIVIMHSFPLRPEYMSLYQWSWILRVSFSSSQSTCMQCVLHKHEKCIKSHFHVVYKLICKESR